MPFAVPIVWRERKDHITNCSFCMMNLKGINRKNKHHVKYPDVPSDMRPIPHDPGLPVPEPDGNMEYRSDSEHSDITVAVGDDAYKPEDDDQPVPLTQAELNDLTRDLNFSKGTAEQLGSPIEEKHLLAPGMASYWYRTRERKSRQFLRSRINYHWFKAIKLLD